MFTGRRFAGTSVTSFPFSTMRPASGSSNPAIIRSVVVLPHPLGPSSEKNSPSAISSVTSSTAAAPPKLLPTPLSAIATRSLPAMGESNPAAFFDHRCVTAGTVRGSPRRTTANAPAPSVDHDRTTYGSEAHDARSVRDSSTEAGGADARRHAHDRLRRARLVGRG